MAFILFATTALILSISPVSKAQERTGDLEEWISEVSKINADLKNMLNQLKSNTWDSQTIEDIDSHLDIQATAKQLIPKIKAKTTNSQKQHKLITTLTKQLQEQQRLFEKTQDIFNTKKADFDVLLEISGKLGLDQLSEQKGNTLEEILRNDNLMTIQKMQSMSADFESKIDTLFEGIEQEVEQSGLSNPKYAPMLQEKLAEISDEQLQKKFQDFLSNFQAKLKKKQAEINNLHDSIDQKLKKIEDQSSFSTELVNNNKLRRFQKELTDLSTQDVDEIPTDIDEIIRKKVHESIKENENDYYNDGKRVSHTMSELRQLQNTIETKQTRTELDNTLKIIGDLENRSTANEGKIESLNKILTIIPDLIKDVEDRQRKVKSDEKKLESTLNKIKAANIDKLINEKAKQKSLKRATEDFAQIAESYKTNISAKINELKERDAGIAKNNEYQKWSQTKKEAQDFLGESAQANLRKELENVQSNLETIQNIIQQQDHINTRIQHIAANLNQKDMKLGKILVEKSDQMTTEYNQKIHELEQNLLNTQDKSSYQKEINDIKSEELNMQKNINNQLKKTTQAQQSFKAQIDRISTIVDKHKNDMKALEVMNSALEELHRRILLEQNNEYMTKADRTRLKEQLAELNKMLEQMNVESDKLMNKSEFDANTKNQLEKLNKVFESQKNKLQSKINEINSTTVPGKEQKEQKLQY